MLSHSQWGGEEQTLIHTYISNLSHPKWTMVQSSTNQPTSHDLKH